MLLQEEEPTMIASLRSTRPGRRLSPCWIQTVRRSTAPWS